MRLFGTTTLSLIPTGKIAELFENYYKKYIYDEYGINLKLNKEILYRTLEETYLTYNKPYRTKYNILSLFHYDKEYKNLVLENIANKQNDFSKFPRKDFTERVEWVLNNIYFHIANIIYKNSGIVPPDTETVFNLLDAIYKQKINKGATEGLISTIFNEYKKSGIFQDDVYESVNNYAKSQNPPLYISNKSKFQSDLMNAVIRAEEEFIALNEFLLPSPQVTKKTVSTNSNNMNTYYIIGGVALLGIGAYFLFNKKSTKKRKR